METFSIRDLRERTGDLVRTAEAGQLSVVAKHGQPVFVAVPFDQVLLEQGVGVNLAIKLYDDGTISLGKAAKLAVIGSAGLLVVAKKMGLVVQLKPLIESWRQAGY